MKILSRRIAGRGRNRKCFVPTSSSNWILFLAACVLVLVQSGCGGWWRSPPPRAAGAGVGDAPADGSSLAEVDTSTSLIRELEDRVKQDPEDFIAFNKLGGYYLQRLRETGDVKYLELATRAAHASLRILPAENNFGALSALAQAEFLSHDFPAARDHALQLVEMDPRKSYPYQILGDALLELGDYTQAALAFRRMREWGGGGIGGEMRLARFDTLHGQTDNVRRRLEGALASALEEVPRRRETVAWCHWQLGELALSAGDYENGERRYRESLAALPDYYRAVAGLARALAARGDLLSATTEAERAVRILPDLSSVALLGDLYNAAERKREAAAQYALVEQIARLSALNGALYNRQLALFYADHDVKAEEAYRLASKEYEVRGDIYGADTLAWTALKAGKISEAQTAIKEALRLGTKDARLFYHAGMIARAAGDHSSARDYLRRALELSPKFDLVQAPLARKALEG